MSLRVRLVLVSVAVAALALIAANLLVYALVQNYLQDRLDERVQELAQFAPNTLFTPPPMPSTQRPSIGHRALPSELVGAYVEIRNANGSIASARFVVSVQDRRQPPTISSAEARVRTGAVRFFNATSRSTSGEIPYRVRVASTRDGRFVIAALPSGDLHDTTHRIALIQFLASSAIVVTGSALTWWLVGLGLRPLRRIEAIAERIAAGDLSQRVHPARLRTEIGRLGASLNTMLGEIETAFGAQQVSEGKLRQFVADASHELRTPLTSIRGYAELLRRGADARPAERHAAARRIEQEAIRLAALVNDLLLLARLEQGRCLDRRPVDLVRLVDELARDARVVDRERTISVDAPSPVKVTGDEDRIAQVVTNLLGNARVHTPPGTAIELRVTSSGDEATIEVIDHGGGVDPDQVAHVFDRFWRADTSRARSSGGAGLGLAIVAAVVEAHGGRCEVQRSQNGGATFRVHLPTSRDDEPHIPGGLPNELAVAIGSS